jgi:DNA-binding transcriptional MerR regulator
MGQILWYAVAKDEKGGYAKNMKNLRLQPVILSVVTYEDIEKRSAGVPLKEIRKCAEARILREADEQSGTLAQSDLSLILSQSLKTIQKDITEYERENNVVLPRRGTVHDLGRSTSHKQVICRKSVLDRKATPDIALETCHSPSAVDRYLDDFERIRFCLKKGLSMKEAAFTTQMSTSLLTEYAELIEELDDGEEKENVN